MEHLSRHLAEQGNSALTSLSDGDLIATWEGAIGDLLTAGSAVRRALDPGLTLTARLSPGALQAALDAVLSGTRGRPLVGLLDRATSLERRHHGLVIAVLASNIPALAVQVLLPALALRRPVLLKSSTREPLAAAALVSLLAARQPAFANSVAAVTWHGGESALEGPVFEIAETIVAFGAAATIESLRTQRRDLLAHGPMMSLAVVSSDADLATAAAGLARDIALFEQRGCLSVQAIYTDADTTALADAVAAELAHLAEIWPPVPPPPELAAGVRQIRQEATLRGLAIADLPLAVGTVVVESETALDATPGLRTVRVHHLTELDQLGPLLEPHRGRIQGVALAGKRASHLESRLRSLEVTRIAPPGELQRPDALWANGETHLIERLA